jgi:endoglucanase
VKMLRVKGNKMTDISGNPVRLRGTCIGGWMNMENFINGYPGTEMGVRSQMEEVLGKSRASFLFDRMRHYFFHEEDIVFIKECGANTVRLPLNYRHFESDMQPFRYLESGFEKLDEIIALCEKHGVYVILDMHAVQGWQNAHWHSDNPKGISLFWDNIQFQDRFVALWEEFARRYAGKSVIAGYNIMNEPCTNTVHGDYPHTFFDKYVPRWDKINAVYRRVAKAIRKIDPDHILFLEGDCYSRYFSGLEAPFDDNLVYSSHNYISAGFGPGEYPGVFSTHRADRQFENGYWDRAKQADIFNRHDGVQFTQKHHVPLWSGEFGAQYNGPSEEIPSRLRAMDDQLDVFEENGTHWTTWTYKDVGVMGWVMLDPESEYMQRIALVQEKKGLLGAENFTDRFVPSPAKKAVKELAALMEGIIHDEDLNPMSNNTCLGQAALTQYAAGLLEPVYAKCFRGLSEEKIDSIMQSFALSRCRINEGLVKVLKKHLSKAP